MAKPNVLVLSGYGINCEEETAYAFELAGGKPHITHVNDVIKSKECLKGFQILTIPGGFSYGDDTGSGKALANKLRNHFFDELVNFSLEDRLMLGICNGFQVLTQLGLVPNQTGRYSPEAALTHNDNAQYICRWVDVDFSMGRGPWCKDLGTLALPIAHGEGRLVHNGIEWLLPIGAKYVRDEMCEHFDLEHNPNGSAYDVAALTDCTGRILGMMPHPERAIHVTQLPHWTLLREEYKRNLWGRLPTKAYGIELFKNGVNYFK